MNGVPQNVRAVGDLTRELKLCIEGAFPEVWVRGEISNFRRQASGHCYFSLKDDRSQIASVLFRGNALRLAMEPRDGMQVLARGEVTVYEPRGNYQLLVRELQEDGVGRLQREFERLKNKLREEGLFENERKRPVPVLPQCIGIITSSTGAALRDMVSVFRRRGWRGELRVFPALVQGASAAADIVRQLERAANMPDLDLLIVARGGGSLEDIWPFNEEIVVRALAASPIPTISAVGHESDFVLTDFAADRRAETPTAAAELITSLRVDALHAVADLKQRLGRRAGHRIELLAQRMETQAGRIAPHYLLRRIESEMQKADEMRERFLRGIDQNLERRLGGIREFSERLARQHPEREITRRTERLLETGSRLRQASTRHTETRKLKLDFTERQLRANGLDQTLRRGFAVVRDTAGKPVSDAGSVGKDGKLRVQMRDGEIDASVDSVRVSVP